MTASAHDRERLEEHRYIDRYDGNDATAGFYSEILDDLDLGPGNRLLDVGCSIGIGLQAGRDRGLDAVGLELDDGARTLAIGRGHRVVEDLLELRGERFSGFILNHVLEHVDAPVAMLTALHGLAGAGAKLFIGVPSGQALWAQVQRERWCFMAPDEHLWYFDPARLRQLLAMTGWHTRSLITSSRRYQSGAGGLVRNLALGVADLTGRGECINAIATLR